MNTRDGLTRTDHRVENRQEFNYTTFPAFLLAEMDSELIPLVLPPSKPRVAIKIFCETFVTSFVNQTVNVGFNSGFFVGHWIVVESPNPTTFFFIWKFMVFHNEKLRRGTITRYDFWKQNPKKSLITTDVTIGSGYQISESPSNGSFETESRPSSEAVFGPGFHFQ